ncbi:MAG: UUP1 family membrane protein [Gammaproteobacteria bacterium]
MKRAHALLLAAVLIAGGGGLMFLKVSRLGLPLLPGQTAPVWTVEARIEFDGNSRAAIVVLDIPDAPGEFVTLDELFVARGYGLNVESAKSDRRAEWSIRRAHGKQRLYYRIELAPSDEARLTDRELRAPQAPAKPDYAEPLASAVKDTLSEVRANSANIFTFVSQLLVQLNTAAPDGNIQIIRSNLDTASEEWVGRLIHVLAGARISARLVRGLVLDDRSSEPQLQSWLEVHNGTQWEGFNPQTGQRGFPDGFLRWSVGSRALLEVSDGRNAEVRFSSSRYAQSLTRVARDRAEATHAWLNDLLLFQLPVSTQNVYRVLLMVPLGALIVALMRTVVGVPTLGTFMPILVAIAFRETQLAWGIALFVLITSVGLSLRFYLERLRLLLVPRLCAVLSLVVLLMLAISLLSVKLGFDQGFSIALFPIIILTMAIEHMSVIWEESGGGAALKEGIGSLFVATLGYLLMTEPHLNHLMFLFPEILLLLLAVFVLLGRYTGYRMTEVLRFRDIVAAEDDVRPRS